MNYRFAILALCISSLASADEPELRLLTGHVSDDTGRPVANALVEWARFNVRHKDRESVRTGKDGSFRLETRKYGSDFRLGVSATGWGPRWAEGVIPAPLDHPEPHRFQLLKPVEVKGQVLDDYGKPIANVVVIARSESRGFHSSFSMPTPSYRFPGSAHEGTTDEDGMFVIRDLPNAESGGFVVKKLAPNPSTPRDYYKFALSVQSRETYTMPRGTAVPGESTTIHVSRNHVSDVKPNGVLKARVFDQQSGQAISRFHFVRRHVPVMNPITSVDGKFELKNLTPGRRYQVFVYADGYAPFVLREPASEDSAAKRVHCPMKKSTAFKGIIVDANGSPISNAHIVAGVVRERSAGRFLWGNFGKYVDGYMGWEFVQRVTTADDGKFHLCVGDSPNTLAVMAPGYARRFIRPDNLPMPDSEGVVRIPLQNECRLKVVVNKNGVPEPNADVWLAQKDNWELDYGRFKADEAGRCEFGELQSGTYKLSVYQYSGSSGTSRLSRWVTLSAGKTIDVVMEKPDGEIVLSGTADPFIMILLRAKDEQMYSNVGTVSDVDGNYRIEGLKKGTYVLSTHRSSGVGGSIRRNGGTEIEITGDTSHDIKRASLFR